MVVEDDRLVPQLADEQVLFPDLFLKWQRALEVCPRRFELLLRG